MFDFILRTDLLRLLLQPKTGHRHYVKRENTSKANTHLTPLSSSRNAVRVCIQNQE